MRHWQRLKILSQMKIFQSSDYLTCCRSTAGKRAQNTSKLFTFLGRFWQLRGSVPQYTCGTSLTIPTSLSFSPNHSSHFYIHAETPPRNTHATTCKVPYLHISTKSSWRMILRIKSHCCPKMGSPQGQVTICFTDSYKLSNLTI